MTGKTIHCPACGATNPDSASWCLQCFTAFEEPVGDDPGQDAESDQVDTGPDGGVAAVAAPGSGPPATAAAGGGEDDATAAAATPTEPGGSDHRFRTTDEGVDWRCAVCDAWNPLELQTCSTCQAPFSRTFSDENDEPPDVDETTALVATIVLPGTGHMLMGRTGTGLSRALIFVVWLAGGWLLLSSASSSDQSTLPAFPLLLGSLIVWVGSILDTRTAVAGGRPENELLRPRVFLWIVVGVVGLLMLTFGASAMSLT